MATAKNSSAVKGGHCRSPVCLGTHEGKKDERVDLVDSEREPWASANDRCRGWARGNLSDSTPATPIGSRKRVPLLNGAKLFLRRITSWFRQCSAHVPLMRTRVECSSRCVACVRVQPSDRLTARTEGSCSRFGTFFKDFAVQRKTK
ncbi:hypothetical protein MRX96_011249 [Rhipicephalus microplus]